MAVMNRKVLIVGCGSIGKRHAECLRDIGIKSLVFFDTDYEKSEKLAALYGGSTVGSYEEGLNTDADAVYILSPTGLHIEQAIEAVKSGKHVFMEKPISDSLDGTDELERLAKEKGVIVEIGFCFRFHEGVKKLIRLIKKGDIGKIVSIRAVMGEHFPDVRPDYLSTYYVKHSGAFELVHDLDLVIYIAEEEPVECSGIYGSYSGLGFESPDMAEMLVRFPSCAANVHLDFFQSPRTRIMTVIGTEGQLILEFSSWDQYILKCYTREKKAWSEYIEKTERNDMFRAESENFFAAMEGKEKNLCPISEAIKSLIVVKAVQKNKNMEKV